MVLQHAASHPALPALRRTGWAIAWLVAMVVGTMAVIAFLAGRADSAFSGADGTPMTRAEIVMQSSAERALVSPNEGVLAHSTQPNEGRGLN